MSQDKSKLLQCMSKSSTSSSNDTLTDPVVDCEDDYNYGKNQDHDDHDHCHDHDSKFDKYHKNY